MSYEGETLAPGWTLSWGLDVHPDPDIFQVGIVCFWIHQAPIVQLATWTALIPSPYGIVRFTVSDVPGSEYADGNPVYASGSDAGILHPLHPSTGHPYTVCAQINGDCQIVGNVPSSWGEIKSLYR